MNSAASSRRCHALSICRSRTGSPKLQGKQLIHSLLGKDQNVFSRQRGNRYFPTSFRRSIKNARSMPPNLIASNGQSEPLSSQLVKFSVIPLIPKIEKDWQRQRLWSLRHLLKCRPIMIKTNARINSAQCQVDMKGTILRDHIKQRDLIERKSLRWRRGRR